MRRILIEAARRKSGPVRGWDTVDHDPEYETDGIVRYLHWAKPTWGQANINAAMTLWSDVRAICD